MYLPEKIYKYQPFDTISISNLKQQQIYFPHPVDFNDPYDCNLELDFKDLTKDDYHKIFKNLLGEKYDEETRAFLDEYYKGNYEYNQEINERIEAGIRNAFTEIKEKLYKGKGIASFSSKNNDILMWAHYADGHKGFCLEFDTSFEPFKKALKVDYSDDIPALNVNLITSDGISTKEATRFLTTKYECWKYEDEYRVIHNETRNEYTYPADSLTGIYFGSKIHKHNLEIIALIIQEQNPNVNMYLGNTRKDIFKIDFDKFDYTPYIETQI